MTDIPMVAVGPDDPAERESWLGALARTIDSNAYCLGREVATFEQACTEYLDIPHVFGVSNGSDALRLALQAVNVGPGDEVIVPALSFFATASCIAHLGAKPVFVDVTGDTLTIDPEAAKRAITDRTRAIIPVHLYGQGAAMDSIQALAKEHEFAIVEDAAQCFGARYRGSALGGVGDVGCFSFYPTKNLAAAGDAGLVVTRSPDIAKRLASLRVHGDAGGYSHQTMGWNARMDGFQGAILAIRLARLPAIQEAREHNARRYLDAIVASPQAQQIRPLGRTDGSDHSWHQFIVRVPDRDRIKQELGARGIGSAVYYPGTLPAQPAFAAMVDGRSFPVAEQSCREGLALPIHHRLADQDPGRVIDAIADILA